MTAGPAGTAGPAVPGTGWPGDPATVETPVARDSRQVRELASGALSLADVDARVSVCRACPRLVEWREDVATTKRAAFASEAYWGRPIAGWGAPVPTVLIVGLAPAAHGGNRTGRVFTGDRSGDWLFRSLHRVGLATSPTSVAADDGQRLIGARLVAAVRCAPPGNQPTPGERDTCAPWLDAELAFVLPSVRVVVALGGFAWNAVWAALVTGVSLAMLWGILRLAFVQFDSGATPDGTYISCQLGPDCTWKRYVADGQGPELEAAGVTDGASFGSYFISSVVVTGGSLMILFTVGGALVAAGFRSLQKAPDGAPTQGTFVPRSRS